MSVEALIEKLSPLVEHLAGVDLSAPDKVAAELNSELPLASPQISEIGQLFAQGIKEGWLCDREAGGARFSRVAKPSEQTHNFSIDAVSMSGPGVWHRHTKGEIDLCFASSGNAKFDGQPEGWVVFGEGSEHVPTVTDGEMHILYFLPDGAVEWK